MEYEFILVGDLDGSLPNPIFELHDASDLLVEGTGDSDQQRIIRFTPDEAATFYLKVTQDVPLSAFDFGGYFISSPQFDEDFLSDSAVTRGVVTPGVLFTNTVDFDGDIDWARLDLEPFYTYQVQTPLTDEVSLVDSSGQTPRNSVFDNDRNVIAGSEEPTDLFVEFSGDMAGEFLFEVVDEHEDTDLSLASEARGSMFGSLSSPGDVDLFEAFMVPFADYELSVDSSILDSLTGDLIVEAVNVDGSVAATFNFNEAQNSFTFLADDGNPTRVTTLALARSQNFRIRSSDDALTGYRVALTPVGVDSIPIRWKQQNHCLCLAVLVGCKACLKAKKTGMSFAWN